MLVADTSALVGALSADQPNEALTARLSADGDLHAPHLVDVEFVHVVRRLRLRDELSAERAEDALREFALLRIVRYPHVGLRARMWELRPNLTAYDAAFVALAEALAVPLVTLDGRIASAPGHTALIEVY